MNCRDPTATPSVMPPSVTAEVLATLRTSAILHSGGAGSRYLNVAQITQCVGRCNMDQRHALGFNNRTDVVTSHACEVAHVNPSVVGNASGIAHAALFQGARKRPPYVCEYHHSPGRTAQWKNLRDQRSMRRPDQRPSKIARTKQTHVIVALISNWSAITACGIAHSKPSSCILLQKSAPRPTPPCSKKTTAIA